MVKEYREDLREDYIPFISMIDFDNDHQLLPTLPELQRETTLPPNALRVAADIMTDILLRIQGQLRPRTSSPHLEGATREGGEEISGRRVRTSSPQKHNIMKMFSEFHIQRDASHLAQHAWTSTTSLPTRSWMRTSTSSGSSCSTSDNVHRVKTTKGLHTSSCVRWVPISWGYEPHPTQQHRPSRAAGVSQPLPAHPSTSTGNRRDQPQDHIIATSGSQRQDCWQLQGGVPTATTLPRVHLGSQHPTFLRQGVITTRTLGWAILHRCSHCPSMTSEISCAIRGRTAKYIFNKSPHTSDQQYTSVWSDINQWADEQQCVQLGHGWYMDVEPSTLTTNIIHSKGAKITINHSDAMDWHVSTTAPLRAYIAEYIHLVYQKRCKHNFWVGLRLDHIWEGVWNLNTSLPTSSWRTSDLLWHPGLRRKSAHQHISDTTWWLQSLHPSRRTSGTRRHWKERWHLRQLAWTSSPTDLPHFHTLAASILWFL